MGRTCEEMQLDLLPLEMWELIWAKVTLLHKARLDLCSKRFHRLVWELSPIQQVECTSKYHSITAIQIFATRPAAARGVQRFALLAPVPPPLLPLDLAFKNTTALTHINIRESNCAVFNALLAGRCPLKNVTIISKSNTFYHQLDLGGVEKLRSTLRRLSLFVDSRDAPTAPLNLVKAIATHLGPTLEALSLNLTDWSPLKPMTALKELTVVNNKFKPRELFNFNDLPSIVAGILARTPPGVGLNLCFLVNGIPSSLLIEAMNSAPRKFQHIIENYPVDVDLAPFGQFETTDRRSLLIRAVLTYQYDIAKVLIEKGARTFWPRARAFQSVFRTALMSWTQPLYNWEPFATYLFDKVWPKAITQCTATELLGMPPEIVLFQVTASAPSPMLPIKLKLILARPAIFGPHSPTELNSNGCNLCHKAPDVDAAKALRDMGVDWRQKDKDGRDALECVAVGGLSTGPNGLLEHWCERDEDFRAHCTPLVWSKVYVEMGFGREHEPDPAFQDLVRRMLLLCPSTEWESIAESIQVQLRENESANFIDTWLSAGGAEFRPHLLQALFRPWCEIRQRPWFKMLRLNEVDLLPLPHCIAEVSQLRLIGHHAKSHFASEAEAMEWINERNDQGQTPQEYFASTLRGKELTDRLESLKLLWPAVDPFKWPGTH